MRFLRWLLAVFFLGLIIFGLWKWYAVDQQVHNTDLISPVWQKISSRVDGDAINKTGTMLDRKSVVDLITTTSTKNTDSDATTTPTQPLRLHSDITTWTLSLDNFKNIVGTTPAIGPSSTDYALIVYCDFDSVYCKQMYQEWTITSYQLASNDNISVYFKWYTTTFDGLESTYNTHHAWLCAERLATWPQRTALQIGLFDLPYQTTEQLVEEWEELGIDWFAWCLLTQDSRSTLLAQNLEAKNLFSITSLPALVFYNKKTGQWFLIPWLYTNEELSDSLQRIFR